MAKRFRPTASLSIDGRALSGPEAALARARVQLGTGSAHDSLHVTLGHQSPVADVDVGAKVELSLGYEDDLETLLTGQVVAIERHPAGVSFAALAAPATLAATRVAQSYVQQTIADIVGDLLGKASVDSGEIDASTKLFAYHIDERSSVWRHLRDLARLAGCELSTAGSGALNFRPRRSGPSSDHTLRAGADLLRWSLGAAGADDGDWDVVPHGAASEEGSEKWHLLLKEPDHGAPSSPTRVPGAVRDRDLAKSYAKAIADASQRRSSRGDLMLVGKATLRAGDLVELTDMPHGEDATLRAARVVHLFDRELGFASAVAVEALP